MAARTPALALFAVGVIALSVAFVCTLYMVGIDGQPDDVILEFGGLQSGGPSDDLIATVGALVLGTVGVVCVLMSWRDIRRP